MKSQAVAFFLALLLAAGPASAHAMLVRAAPTADASVASPAEVRLDFSQRLESSFSGVTVSDSSGHSVASGDAMTDEKTIRVKLKPLTAGVYRVQWHAVSVDTHRTEGAYRFTVQ